MVKGAIIKEFPRQSGALANSSNIKAKEMALFLSSQIPRPVSQTKNESLQYLRTMAELRPW